MVFTGSFSGTRWRSGHGRGHPSACAQYRRLVGSSVRQFLFVWGIDFSVSKFLWRYLAALCPRLSGSFLVSGVKIQYNYVCVRVYY